LELIRDLIIVFFLPIIFADIVRKNILAGFAMISRIRANEIFAIVAIARNDIKGRNNE